MEFLPTVQPTDNYNPAHMEYEHPDNNVKTPEPNLLTGKHNILESKDGTVMHPTQSRMRIPERSFVCPKLQKCQ